MRHRSLVWLTVLLAVPVLLIAYALWEIKDQRQAREELFGIYSTLDANTSPARLRQLVAGSRLLFLNNETNPRPGFAWSLAA